MAFQSNTMGFEVIDDSNAAAYAKNILDNAGMGGYVPRDFEAVPYGSVVEASEEPLIPESEWRDRIEEMERNKSGLNDLHDQLQVPILNQGQLPFCWCYGTIGAIMTAYAASGQAIPHLSATSLASKITNYVARGWWAAAAIEGIQKFGCSPIKYPDGSVCWPEHEMDRRYDTQKQRTFASNFKATRWRELQSNSFAHLMSSLFRRRPTTMGLPWWGHLVFGLQPVYSRGDYGIIFANSWDYSWGKKGKGILMRSKATAFEQFEIIGVSHNEALSA